MSNEIPADRASRRGVPTALAIVAFIAPVAAIASTGWTEQDVPSALAPTPTQDATAAAASKQSAPSAGESTASKQDASSVPTPAPAQAEIIEGTVNPYTFEPKDPDGGDAAAFRTMLEGLGQDAIEWTQHVLTLSNPFFEGRAPGSRGSDLTHEYVEFWLKKAGLEAAFPAKSSSGLTTEVGSNAGAGAESVPWTSFRQEWLLPGGAVEVASTTLRAGDISLERAKDFEVMGSSGEGTVSAPLAFAGYGIEEGRDGYTSFAESADFAGRVVILMRYEPLNDEGKSQWAERRFSEHSPIVRKLAAVSKRNPAGIILVNPPGAVDGRSGLESTDSSAFGPMLSVPFMQMSQDAANALLAKADPQGRDLMALRKAADGGTQLSFNLRDDVKVELMTDIEEGGTKASNIGGVVRGKGSLAGQWVIIGAHLDHVGMGMFGTSGRFRGQLHPGADDNASGTAAMLVLARRIGEWAKSDAAPADMRSFLFLGFDAEESGLQGSREYTRAPTLSLDSINAMVNLDMVGRLRNDELTVAGVGTAEGFLDLVRPTFLASGLKVHADPSGRGPSDHASFYSAGVPVLFIFTGSHGDYHRPSDQGHTVNPAGAVKVIALAESLARQLATDTTKLTFTKAERTAGRDRGYARVRLGIQPGLVEENEVGVKVESVSEGTSAAEAGIQPGDIMLAWNGSVLENTSGMMDMLRGHKPGDKVLIRIKRGADTMEIEVTLKESTQRRPE